MGIAFSKKKTRKKRGGKSSRSTKPDAFVDPNFSRSSRKNDLEDIASEFMLRSQDPASVEQMLEMSAEDIGSSTLPPSPSKSMARMSRTSQLGGGDSPPAAESRRESQQQAHVHQSSNAALRKSGSVHDDLPPREEIGSALNAKSLQRTVINEPIRWQRGGLIGAGSYGRVYLGLNMDTGELLAVKQLPLVGSDSDQVKAMMELAKEIDLMKNLAHENIVQYLGSERTPEFLNVFLEYVPGGSIASLLSKFGSFNEKLIRMYTRQILLGLDYLHGHNIVHRDIKGANILVDTSGSIKLADFGASVQTEAYNTAAGGLKSLRGTPYWMAPEVIRQSGYGRPADIWSVACTVVEMATGKPPWFHLKDHVSALFHIASTKEIPEIPSHISPEGKDFLVKCFNRRNPKARPGTTELLTHAFVADIATFNDGATPRNHSHSQAANTGGPAMAAAGADTIRRAEEASGTVKNAAADGEAAKKPPLPNGKPPRTPKTPQNRVHPEDVAAPPPAESNAVMTSANEEPDAATNTAKGRTSFNIPGTVGSGASSNSHTADEKDVSHFVKEQVHHQARLLMAGDMWTSFQTLKTLRPEDREANDLNIESVRPQT